MDNEIVDLIIKILGWIIPACLAFIIGRLTKKVDKHEKEAEEEKERQKQEADALKETCKYILKKSLKDDYEYYVEKQGWCSVTDKAEVEKAYKIYSGPGIEGNGQGTMYYKAIMALPEHSSEHSHGEEK